MTAQLTITPGQVSAAVRTFGLRIVRGTIPPVSFQIAFPPPSPAPAANGSNPQSAASPSAASPPAVNPHHRRSGQNWFAVFLGLVVAIASSLTATMVVLRRHHHPDDVAFSPSTSFNGQDPPPAKGSTDTGITQASPVPATVAVSAIHDASTVVTPSAGAPQAVSGPVIRLLGPVQAAGWSEEPSRPVLELAAFLALHQGRALSSEQVRTALGAGRAKAINPATLRTYAAQLRRALGQDRVPAASDGGGYQLTDVVTDWDHMQQLVAATPDANPAAAVRQLQTGLSLVRGAPLTAADGQPFEWAPPEVLGRMDMVIADASDRLSRLALEIGQPELASWAAGQGLLVDPTNERLLEHLLTAAATYQDIGHLSTAWRDVNRRLTAGQETPSEYLEDRYRTLRSSLRSSSA
jgi:hypothetical protein